MGSRGYGPHHWNQRAGKPGGKQSRPPAVSCRAVWPARNTGLCPGCGVQVAQGLPVTNYRWNGTGSTVWVHARPDCVRALMAADRTTPAQAQVVLARLQRNLSAWRDWPV